MSKSELTKLQRDALLAAAVRNDATIYPILSKPGLNAGSTAKLVETLIAKGLAEERLAVGKMPAWRTTDDGRRIAVTITAGGLSAIGMLPAGKAGRRSRAAPVAAKEAVVAAVSDKEPPSPRPGTKLATMVALLTREQGASPGELADATGWQVHTIRGTMSGALKKRFGLIITSEQIDGRGRIYRAARKR